MTLESRIKLGYILVQLTGNLDDHDAWEDIEDAIALSDEEKSAVGLKENRNDSGDLQGASWTPLSEALQASKEIEFEKADAKKLSEFMVNFTGFRKTDRQWARAFRAALKATT